MERLWQDLRQGARILAHNPGFTAIAVVALALGIGPNTAIFSVVNAVLLTPPPYEAPDTLVTSMMMMRPGTAGAERYTSLSTDDFQDWRSSTRTLDRMALYSGDTLTLTGGEEPVRLNGSRVSPALFLLLHVQPMIGRAFTEAEEKPSGPRSVILSHSLWEKRFGSDRSIIGRPIMLDSNGWTVVGIMPPSFAFPNSETEYWTPLTLAPTQRSANQRLVMVVPFIARLRPGVSIQQAEAEGTALIQQIRRDYPSSGPPNANPMLHLMTLQEQLAGQLRPALVVLLAAVGFVLLIACANVANLLLARATDRARELSIRAALGAGRLRLFRQMLTESVLLSLVGGALGVLLGFWALSILPRLAPGNLPRLASIHIDDTVLLFSLLLSLVSGVLFGSVPALRLLRASTIRALKEGGQQTAAGLRIFRHSKLRSLLAIAEFALAFMLLIGAGLLANSFLRLSGQKPGYEPRGVLMMQLSLPRARYPQPQLRSAFYDQMLEQLRNLPGAQAAGLSNLMPMTPAMWRMSFDIPGRPPADSPSSVPVAGVRMISPGFFGSLATPIVDGRDLSPDDRESTEPVAMINQSLARRYFSGESAVGRQIGIAGAQRRVIGIAGDIRPQGLDSEPQPEIYIPYSQFPFMNAEGPLGSMNFIVRATGDPLALVPAVRARVKTLDPQLPVYNITTLERRISDSVAQPRFYAALLSVFAVLALVLAAVGIYGILSYHVSQCTREIGLRIALGARQGNVLGLVMLQGLTLTAMGMALGITGAWGASRFLSTLLFGITPTDPTTYIGTAGFMALIGLVGAYIPARRATSVDPIIALRCE